LLALPASASASVARTWVSGIGDDANASSPTFCSRTAPCRTFAGAFSATSAGGEIDVFDSGGYGALTITRAVTINATGVTAGVVVSSTNAITVLAAASDTVILRGLDINGLNGTASPSLDGVKVTQAGTVRIEDSSIYGFGRNGINFAPTNPGAKLFVENTTIHDNTGNGVLVDPPVGGSAVARLSNDAIESGACGIVASSLGGSDAGPFTTNCGTPAGGAAAGAATLTATNTSASGNAGAGVLSNGAGIAIGGDVVTNNATGLQELNGGTIQSLGDNDVFSNGADGSPTSTTNVFVGPAGPVGPIGPRGVTGSVGAPGATGPAGARGTTGKVELASCKTVTTTKKVHGKKRKVSVQKCTGRLVSSPVKLTIGSAADVTVSQSGRVYASGSAHRSGGATSLALTSSRPLTAGRYTLTLSRGGRVIVRETITIGFARG
jgi:hypothetical protein